CNFRTAISCSRYKTPFPIVAVCRHAEVCRQLNLCRAVFPVFYNKPKQNDYNTDTESRINHGIEFGKGKGFINRGDFIVVINGSGFGSGLTNTVRVITAA
ncbi:pyruvate kinase, alpha/beta domain protein, partial [Ostertagia ostertagi]